MPFDIAAARKSGKSDAEIASYLGSKLGFDVDAATKAGKTPTQIAEYLSTNERPVSTSRTRYSEEVPRTVSQLARPVLEYGGMIGGSLAGGGPLTPTGIAGAGLGYAGGKLSADYLDEKLGIRESPDALERVRRTGMAATEGAMMEMGGGILGNVAQRGGKAISESGLPEWLYSKALKTPMGEAWKRTIPTKDWTRRERALELGLKEEIKPNALGKNQVLNRINEIEADVNRIVTDLTKESEAIKLASTTRPSTTGSPIQRAWENFNKTPPAELGFDTNVYDITKVLEPLKGKAAMARDSATAGKAVNKIAEEVIKKGGVRARLNPSELQTLKQEFYKDVDWDKTKAVMDENGRFTTEATKVVAKKAMTILEGFAPELQYLNKTQGAYIDLQKAVEHTIARYETRDAVGIGAKILSIRNIGLAALEIVTGTPSVKAALAFALRKAGNVGAKGGGRPLMIYGNKEEGK